MGPLPPEMSAGEICVVALPRQKFQVSTGSVCHFSQTAAPSAVVFVSSFNKRPCLKPGRRKLLAERHGHPLGPSCG